MSVGRNRKWIAGHVLAWMIGLAAVVHGAAGVCRAQKQPQAAAKPAPAAAPASSTTGASGQARAASAAAPKTGGGMHEAIKVHGHWMIEVRSPKGKLLSHTEFENSLYTAPGAGAYVLPSFLSQNLSGNNLNDATTPGEWGILLGDSQSPPCSASVTSTAFNNPEEVFVFSPAYGGNYCVVTQHVPPAAIYPTKCGSGNSGCSYNLTLAPSNSGFSLVLSGSVVSQSEGTISQVQTLLSTCGSNIAPQSCWSETTPDSLFDTVSTFTYAPLPQSSSSSSPCGGNGQISCKVTVPEAGDTINVQVTLSFQ